MDEINSSTHQAVGDSAPQGRPSSQTSPLTMPQYSLDRNNVPFNRSSNPAANSLPTPPLSATERRFSSTSSQSSSPASHSLHDFNTIALGHPRIFQAASGPSSAPSGAPLVRLDQHALTIGYQTSSWPPVDPPRNAYPYQPQTSHEQVQLVLPPQNYQQHRQPIESSSGGVGRTEQAVIYPATVTQAVHSLQQYQQMTRQPPSAISTDSRRPSSSGSLNSLSRPASSHRPSHHYQHPTPQQPQQQHQQQQQQMANPPSQPAPAPQHQMRPQPQSQAHPHPQSQSQPQSRPQPPPPPQPHPHAQPQTRTTQSSTGQPSSPALAHSTALLHSLATCLERGYLLAQASVSSQLDSFSKQFTEQQQRCHAAEAKVLILEEDRKLRNAEYVKVADDCKRLNEKLSHDMVQIARLEDQLRDMNRRARIVYTLQQKEMQTMKEEHAREIQRLKEQAEAAKATADSQRYEVLQFIQGSSRDEEVVQVGPYGIPKGLADMITRSLSDSLSQKYEEEFAQLKLKHSCQRAQWEKKEAVLRALLPGNDLPSAVEPPTSFLPGPSVFGETALPVPPESPQVPPTPPAETILPASLSRSRDATAQNSPAAPEDAEPSIVRVPTNDAENLPLREGPPPADPAATLETAPVAPPASEPEVLVKQENSDPPMWPWGSDDRDVIDLTRLLDSPLPALTDLGPIEMRPFVQSEPLQTTEAQSTGEDQPESVNVTSDPSPESSRDLERKRSADTLDIEEGEVQEEPASNKRARMSEAEDVDMEEGQIVASEPVQQPPPPTPPVITSVALPASTAPSEWGTRVQTSAPLVLVPVFFPPQPVPPTQPAPAPVTTAPAKVKTEQAESNPKPQRALSIQHFILAYHENGNRLICRLCLHRRQVEPALKPKTFPKDAPWLELSRHCEQEHPTGFDALLNMSPTEIATTRQQLLSHSGHITI